MSEYIDRCPCHIHSLNGEMREATILEKTGDNKYLAQYGDVKCTAIFNYFTGQYYVDDKYGIVRDHKPHGQER